MYLVLTVLESKAMTIMEWGMTTGREYSAGAVAESVYLHPEA